MGDINPEFSFPSHSAPSLPPAPIHTRPLSFSPQSRPRKHAHRRSAAMSEDLSTVELASLLTPPLSTPSPISFASGLPRPGSPQLPPLPTAKYMPQPAQLQDDAHLAFDRASQFNSPRPKRPHQIGEPGRLVQADPETPPKLTAASWPEAETLTDPRRNPSAAAEADATADADADADAEAAIEAKIEKRKKRRSFVRLFRRDSSPPSAPSSPSRRAPPQSPKPQARRQSHPPAPPEAQTAAPSSQHRSQQQQQQQHRSQQQQQQQQQPQPQPNLKAHLQPHLQPRLQPQFSPSAQAKTQHQPAAPQPRTPHTPHTPHSPSSPLGDETLVPHVQDSTATGQHASFFEATEVATPRSSGELAREEPLPPTIDLDEALSCSFNHRKPDGVLESPFSKTSSQMGVVPEEEEDEHGSETDSLGSARHRHLLYKTNSVSSNASANRLQASPRFASVPSVSLSQNPRTIAYVGPILQAPSPAPSPPRSPRISFEQVSNLAIAEPRAGGSVGHSLSVHKHLSSPATPALSLPVSQPSSPQPSKKGHQRRRSLIDRLMRR